MTPKTAIQEMVEWLESAPKQIWWPLDVLEKSRQLAEQEREQGLREALTKWLNEPIAPAIADNEFDLGCGSGVGAAKCAVNKILNESPAEPVKQESIPAMASRKGRCYNPAICDEGCEPMFFESESAIRQYLLSLPDSK